MSIGEVLDAALEPATPRSPLERSADATTRGGHGRRIVALFRPYRGRLAAVLGLILVSARLGMVSPFLLREILDVAIPEKDRELLAWLVGGMIAISVVTGVLGVGQTWLSNLVGQRVMHDLRTQVYRHLQRLSLAFFTRTRTGEIQSRIANDIGGVQTVVTTTATSIVSNVTTVVASVVAMFLLDWRLALFSLGLLPFFVLLARRVGNQRKKITTVKQGAMADISSLVQESLSVSGILLGKTMGRGAELADRFEGESARLADLEVRSRMAGRWMMASIQTSFAVMPALVYLFAGLSPSAVSIGTVVAFTTLQTRLFLPMQSLLNVGVDIQTSTALFDRVFEYLDLPVDIHPGTRELRRRATASCASTTSGSPTTTSRRCAASTSWSPPGTQTALVGETGSGKTTLGYLAARLYDPERGTRAPRRRRRSRELTLRLAGRGGRRRLAGDLPVPRLACARTCASRGPTRPTRRSRRRRAPRRSTTRSRRCPRATTPSSASAASASPAARSSGSRSPARSCATRPCWCSTRRPARSTCRRSARSARRSSGSPRAARRS